MDALERFSAKAITPLTVHRIGVGWVLAGCVLVSTGLASAATVARPQTDRPSQTSRLGNEYQPPTFVLIIDDMGLHWERGLTALALPGPITYAFLPYRAHVKPLANYAHQLHKEIMLHMPMSNTRKMPLGEGALTPYQDERTFKARLTSALAAVPYVQGMNNHMGSLLTTHPKVMHWVMDTLQQQHLYFVDSRTSAKSVAYEVAQSRQMPSLVRDVFLDHSRDPKDIHDQFKRAIRTAQTYGSVTVIAHPYPETLDYLQSALPKLAYLGISQASVSGMLRIEKTTAAGEGDTDPLSRIVHFHNRQPLAVDAEPLDAVVESIRRRTPSKM